MKKINMCIYILLLNASLPTMCMWAIFQTVIKKISKKNEEVEEKKENKEAKSTNSLERNNILTLSPKIPKIFDGITLDKENLSALSKGFGAAAAVALLAYYYKNDLSNIKKDISNEITEHKNISIENKKKAAVKKKLNDIAGKDYEKFRLITIEDLEEIFLPDNLDLINDFYQIGCCTWNSRTKKEYKTHWIKPDIIFEDQVLYFEDTLLTIACRAGNFEVCKWLLKHGADPNLHGGKKDRDYIEGDTPLFSCLNQFIDDLDKWNSKTKWTRDKAEELFQEQHEKLKPYLELLLQHGANPNVYSLIPTPEKLSLMNNI